MKVRLDHSFDSNQRTLTLILNRDENTKVVVDQWDYDLLSEQELQLIGRFTAGMNMALEKMWH